MLSRWRRATRTAGCREESCRPVEREIDATPDAFALANAKLKSRVSAVGGRRRRCAVPAQQRTGKAFAFANVKLKSRVSAAGGCQRRCAVPAQRRPGGGDRRSSVRQPWPHARARILE
ncbi:hypothetical protein WS79_22440 [Burkholderia territorii]|nr:hypothetical protein WS79_22440 [Burkholderia territorii]